MYAVLNMLADKCWKESDAKGCPAVPYDRLGDKQYNKHCMRCMSLHQVRSLRSHLQAAGKMWIQEHRTIHGHQYIAH